MEFKSIKVGPAKLSLLFKDIYFVPSDTLATPANDTLKFDTAIKACLINLNFILYYSFLLIICAYPWYH